MFTVGHVDGHGYPGILACRRFRRPFGPACSNSVEFPLKLLCFGWPEFFRLWSCLCRADSIGVHPFGRVETEAHPGPTLPQGDDIVMIEIRPASHRSAVNEGAVATCVGNSEDAFVKNDAAVVARYDHIPAGVERDLEVVSSANSRYTVTMHVKDFALIRASEKLDFSRGSHLGGQRLEARISRTNAEDHFGAVAAELQVIFAP